MGDLITKEKIIEVLHWAYDKAVGSADWGRWAAGQSVIVERSHVGMAPDRHKAGSKEANGSSSDCRLVGNVNYRCTCRVRVPNASRQASPGDRHIAAYWIA